MKKARRASGDVDVTRRELLRKALALPLVANLPPALSSLVAAGDSEPLHRSAPHVAVVGAGAFGGWTALSLRRLGARVTLFDAWGAGNSRASSGGETRVIRGLYGDRRVYVDMAARSLLLWRENEKRLGIVGDGRLYRRTGLLWMFQDDDSYARASLSFMREARLVVHELTLEKARRRFPQVDFDGVRSVFLEEEAGFLKAREACEAVRAAFVAEGGEYRVSAVTPNAVAGGEIASVRLSDGTAFRADRFVFACGPWLGKLFPDVVGELIRPTRQEVFFFGVPAGDRQFSEDRFPAWVDFADRLFYGIPGNERRGFKVADDTHGEAADPSTMERLPTAEGLERARSFLGKRFPLLGNAPLLEARVCQYENTPDSHFIIDNHPTAANVWLVGGGSGHGFKMGPAVGEHVASLVLDTEKRRKEFSLARFARSGKVGSIQPPSRI
ncbi:MAG: FAD-dependent oxidoreductase [Gemmatimonadaceae bacterium]